jgi:putative ABC transport system permease protein
VGVTERKDLIAHYSRLLDAVQNVPGLSGAGLVAPLPLAGVDANATFSVEGKPNAPGERPLVKLRVASAGYFATLGLTLLRGRAFAETDTADAPQVAIVSESLARRYFGGEDPVGRRVSMSDAARGPWYTVVGVVKDVRGQSVAESDGPELYRPFRQYFFAPFSSALVLRTAAPDPAQAAGEIQRYIRAAHPEQPVVDVFAMPEVVSRSLAQPRFYTLLLAVFAMLAVLLATAGLYGVLSYAVSQRMREIAVRVALGAPRRAVLGLVIGHAMAVVAVGLGLGVAGALALTRYLSAQLYGVHAADPATYAAVCALLAVVAALAALGPARRALGADPAAALRCD